MAGVLIGKGLCMENNKTLTGDSIYLFAAFIIFILIRLFIVFVNSVLFTFA